MAIHLAIELLRLLSPPPSLPSPPYLFAAPTFLPDAVVDLVSYFESRNQVFVCCTVESNVVVVSIQTASI